MAFGRAFPTDLDPTTAAITIGPIFLSFVWRLGGSGNDTIIGNDSVDYIYGFGGNDSLLGGGNGDLIRGGDGGDYAYGNAGRDSIYGDDGPDWLEGGSNDDLIRGGDGNDTIRGDAGADTLYGGPGVDLIEGGEGDDMIFAFGGDGPFNIFGGPGDGAHMEGGPGADSLFGAIFSDDDAISYAQSSGPVAIDLADNYFAGGDAQGDVVYSVEDVFGSAYDDDIVGDEHDQYLYGRGGDDMLDGLGGNDSLWGGDGDDEIRGRSGDDTLNGRANGGGATYGDIMTGDAGFDVFAFDDDDHSGLGVGLDVITDFSIAEDVIDLDVMIQGATTFIGEAASFPVGTGGNQIRYEHVSDATYGDATLLFARSSDFDADFAVLLAGHLDLTEANLVY